jgi:hypothetical protein
LFDNKLTAGNFVMHERFGKGEVLNLDGVGADKKAEIKFDVGGINYYYVLRKILLGNEFCSVLILLFASARVFFCIA